MDKTNALDMAGGVEDLTGNLCSQGIMGRLPCQRQGIS